MATLLTLPHFPFLPPFTQKECSTIIYFSHCNYIGFQSLSPRPPHLSFWCCKHLYASNLLRCEALDRTAAVVHWGFELCHINPS